MTAIAFGTAPLVERLTLQWFVRDLDIRAQLISGAIYDPLVLLVDRREKEKVQAVFEHFIKDERLFAIALCSAEGKVL